MFQIFAVKRCARCQQGIFASELVMRARDLVYHLHCFTCAWCNAALTQGDHFGLRDNLVYCRVHYELLVHGTGPLDPMPCEPSVSPPPPYAIRKGRPRKRKELEQAASQHPLGLQVLDVGLPPLDGSSSSVQPTSVHPQRTKRMRTSFKHHQLRTMKAYFSINQNPDAKDLKQLAQKTGLSKRVLQEWLINILIEHELCQVWFQNARAKWRRNTHKGGGDLSLQTPAPATSPGAISSFSDASPAPPAPLDYPDVLLGTPADHLASFQELF
ncbi:LHX2 [Cordylochernes scorpioides]|uniref:LHX2 n=1 Tax=Cordylochernes scorpioides TaxID=51811 RepID=A0ABY6K1I2_9ARAC|nr:LHX2 [Cordylochernes scorpioides]